MRKIISWSVIILAALSFLRFVPSTFLISQEIDNKIVNIEQGMNVVEIANLLKENNIIIDRGAFIFYVTAIGRRGKIQAGMYSFDGTYKTYQIANLITGGASLAGEKSVLVPEGFTARQIDEELKEANLNISGLLAQERASSLKGEFAFLSYLPEGEESLEGFLFPDTYNFKADSASDSIARKMLNNFGEKTKDLQEESRKKGIDFYKAVIIASILEKEVPLKDMSDVAGIIEKRLEAGIPLQVDATLVYVLGRKITTDDTQSLKSPYNTYQYKGLPPTPISNPGIAAIEAALNPANNSYWYYLSRPSDGETIFSKTLDEHNKAKAKYLR